MPASALRVAAALIVALHAFFVLFVMLGGLLALRWRRLAWVHVPAAVWGIAIEFGGWMCPLAPLEDHLRQRCGVPPYGADFVEHYALPLLYPASLTRSWEWSLGSIAVAVN